MSEFKPTAEQERALAILKDAIDRRAPAARLLGPGGSGKTTLVQWIVEHCGGPDKVILLSTTNAAAHVLGRACNVPCRTVDSALRTHFTEEGLMAQISKCGPDGDFPTANFELYTTYKMLHPDSGDARAIIIDECSMISVDKMHKLCVSLLLMGLRARRGVYPKSAGVPYKDKATSKVELAKLGVRDGPPDPQDIIGSYSSVRKSGFNAANTGVWARPEVWIQYAKTSRIFGNGKGLPTIIFVGDILQLGPVKLKEEHGHHHDSPWWGQVLHPIEVALSGNVRAAKDPVFASHLAQFRLGEVALREFNRNLKILSRAEINGRISRADVEQLPLMIMGNWDAINEFNLRVFNVLVKKYPFAWRDVRANDVFEDEKLERLLAAAIASVKRAVDVRGSAPNTNGPMRKPQHLEWEKELDELLPRTINVCIGYKLLLMTKLSPELGLLKNACCTVIGLGTIPRSLVDAERERRATIDVEAAEAEGRELKMADALAKQSNFIECIESPAGQAADPASDVLRLARWNALHERLPTLRTLFPLNEVPPCDDKLVGAAPRFDLRVPCILCRFDNGRYIVCCKAEAGIYRRMYDPSRRRYSDVRVAYRQQFPFLAAMAITCHRAQGQTLQNACVWLTERAGNIDGGIFGPGAAYVAFSRAEGFDGIYATRTMESWHLVADKGCVDWVKKLEEASREASKLAADRAMLVDSM